LREVRDTKHTPEQGGNEDRGRDIGEAHNIGLKLRASWLCRLAVGSGGVLGLGIFRARDDMNARVTRGADQLLRK